MQLTLTEIRQETPDTKTFFFDGGPALSWKAGQFIHYKLPHANPDERGIERYFSIASAPHEHRVMLTCRFAKRSSSFKRALEALPCGAKIEAEAPDGDFCVDRVSQRLIFIAGGIGITPFRAILLDLEQRREPLDVTLLYANRTEDVVFRSELEVLRSRHSSFKIHYFIGDNHLDGNGIRKVVPDLPASRFYVSGPEPMVESIDQTLEQMAVPKDQIMNDFFPGYEWP